MTRGSETDSVNEALATGRWKIPVTYVGELEESSDLHRKFENREICGKPLICASGHIS